LGDPRAVEPLIPGLGDREENVRKAAAKALGQLGEGALAETVLAALKGNPQTVVDLGDPRAVEPLIAAIGDENERVRQGAARALGQLGDPHALEPLTAALDDESKWVRQAAVISLGRIGDRRAVEMLFVVLGRSGTHRVLGDRDEDVREAAAIALGQIGDRRAVEPLIAVFRDPLEETWGVGVGVGVSVRMAAAVALAQIGDRRFVEALIATLVKMGKDSYERLAAAYYSGQLSNRGVVELLIAALGNKKGMARSFVAKTLGQIGDRRSVQPLIAALGDGDSFVREAAARALGQLGEGALAEAVLAALKCEAQAVVELGDPRAVNPLITALGDRDEDVRWAATTALVQIGPSTVQALTAALGDENEWVRQAAAKALGQIGSPAVKKKEAVAFVCQRCSVPVITAAERLRRLGRLAKEYGLTLDEQGRLIQEGGLRAFDWKDSLFGAMEYMARREAVDTEIQRKLDESSKYCGFRCKSCGEIYCLTCLKNYAPTHSGTGGKACFKCGGSLESLEE